MKLISWLRVKFGQSAIALQSLAGRAVSGIAVFCALAWFLWPSSSWRPEPEPLGLLIVSLIAWLGSLQPTQTPAIETPASPTPHDVRLLSRFRETVTEAAKRFLTDQDLLGSFNWKQIDCLMEISHDWRGAEFAFDDADIQGRFAPLVDNIRAFTNQLAVRTYVIRGRDEWASVLTDNDREFTISDHTRQIARELNELATNLATEIDDFIRFARPRLDKA